MPPVQAAMASQDWVAAKVLLQAGADEKVLNTIKQDAVTFYCNSIGRMKRNAYNQGVVHEVGVLLKIPELRPDCVADMERFR